MNLGEDWTFVLETTAQIIIPVWNDLIQYLPLLIVLLLIATIAGLIWMWQRNSATNRSRVPRRLPSGRKPADMHLPGPSLWPFVAPIGLVLMAFAVVFGVFDSLANMALFGLGLAIGVIGVLGWYTDAGKEYAAVEAGAHGDSARLAATVQPPGIDLVPGSRLFGLAVPRGRPLHDQRQQEGGSLPVEAGPRYHSSSRSRKVPGALLFRLPRRSGHLAARRERRPAGTSLSPHGG